MGLKIENFTDDDFLDARKTQLDIGTKKLVYVYDFGDGW
jgi:hypothetical protein